MKKNGFDLTLGQYKLVGCANCRLVNDLSKIDLRVERIDLICSGCGNTIKIFINIKDLMDHERLMNQKNARGRLL
ncbi:hypothetical protein ACFL08_01685 [Patescibacteria group bacterium]